MLVNDDYPLNPAEAFVLGGAFLAHDLGMGLSAYPGGLPAIVTSLSWRDQLAARYPDTHEAINGALMVDVAANPTWDGISSQAAKALLIQHLRQHHAEQAEKVLTQPRKTSSGETYYLLPDTSLRHWYGAVIGKIARSHWHDVGTLPELLPPALGPVPGFPTSWTVDPVKIACILRLADAIQIDARRADPLHTPNRMPQGESADHWHLQEKMLSVQTQDRRLIFSSASPFGVDLVNAWWTGYEMVRMIDSELRRVDNLCGDSGIARMAVSSAAGAESPKRFSQFVQTDGWRPIDARPYIGDQNLIMRRLGGDALYGAADNHYMVPLRELLANALDATRAIRMAYSTEPKPIEVQLSVMEGQDVLLVRDFGIGMTAQDITDRLCNFGTSGWKDSAAQSAFPGLISAGFNPTGQFGIGFFSVFMVADRVRVRTRHVTASMSETLILDFTEGFERRPILKEAKKEDQLLEPGTEITLRLRLDFDDFDGLFGAHIRDALENDAEFASIVRTLSLMADENIDTFALGGTRSRAVERNMWERCSPGELFDAMNLESAKLSPHYASLRAHFEEAITPIRDSKGVVVGRVAFDNHSRTELGERWVNMRRGYSGGLEVARPISPFMGVYSGSPSGASRDGLKLDISLEELGLWFDGQVEKVTGFEVSDDIKLRMQALGVRIGQRSKDLPLAYAEGKFQSIDEIRRLLASRQHFLIVEQQIEVLKIDESEYHVIQSDYSDAYARPTDEMLCIPEPYFGFTRDFPSRDLDDIVWPEDSDGDRGWWEFRFNSLTGELLRLAAETWTVPLPNLISEADVLGAWEAGADSRLEIPTLDGSTLKLNAIRVYRPGS